jgi:hypothetical protein
VGSILEHRTARERAVLLERLAGCSARGKRGAGPGRADAPRVLSAHGVVVDSVNVRVLP